MKIIIPFLFFLVRLFPLFGQSYAEINERIKTFDRQMKITEALRYVAIGKQKALAEFGNRDSIYASYVYASAIYHNQMAQSDLAMSEFLEVQPIFEQTIGKQSIIYSRLLRRMADMYRHLQQWEKAEALYAESLSIQAAVTGNNNPEYAKHLIDFAYLHQNRGNYDAAEPLLLESVAILRNSLGNEHLFYGYSLEYLAVFYKEIGRYDAAEPLYLESIAIQKKNNQTQHPIYAGTLNNLAALYLELKRNAQALPLSLESLEILKNTVGERHPNYPNTLNQIANIYEALGDLPKAELYAVQARNLYGQSVGKQHAHYAIVTNNLAELYLQMKRYELAKPLFLEAYAIQRASLDESHPNCLKMGNNIARLYQYQGDTTAAWNALAQTILITSGIVVGQQGRGGWLDSLQEHEWSSIVKAEYAVQSLRIAYDLLQKKDDKEQRQRVAATAMAILDKSRQRMTNEKDKLRLLALSNDWVALYLDVLDVSKQLEEAFLVAEQNKSVLLMEASKSEQAHQIGDLPDSLFKKERALIARYDQLQAGLSEKISEQEKRNLRDKLNTLNIETISFKEQIERDYPRYAQWKYQPSLADIGSLKALLDNETAILEYVVTDTMIYIFHIDLMQAKGYRVLLPKGAFEYQAQRLQRALSDYAWISAQPDSAFVQYSEAAYWFYQTIISTAVGHSRQDIRHFIVIPDGRLAHLPFETFLSKPAEAGQSYADLAYLIRDYRISYNYSATLWKENRSHPDRQNNGKILAMAANYTPLKDSSVWRYRSATDLQLRKQLTPLPAVCDEVTNLADRFYGSFLCDSAATEMRFKSDAPQYSILHLAMHGLLNQKNPILSSLAFTEDADSLENNFLQAYEISQMQLNADLVVLSACETGFGRFEKGNGTASLARAFMYAGVPALVVSLWEVNDAATSNVMTFFYEELAAGKDKAEALRQAKLRYLSKAKGIAAHPAYWSAFVQMGDSRPVPTGFVRQQYGWWLVAGLLSFFLSAFGFWKMRRKNS